MENKRTFTTGNVDSSLGAKLAAKGIAISVENTEETKNEAERKREIELIEKSLRESQKNAQENRNRSGNGRKAGPELIEALKEAGVLTAEERHKIRTQFEREKNILENEIKEAEINIREALTQKKGREAHNWDIRLQKSKAILDLYKEAASFVDSDTGKDILESLHRYAKARAIEAQKQLAADAFDQTGKFVAQNPKEKVTGAEESTRNQNTALDGTVFKDGIPVLTEVVDIDKLPVLTEVVFDKNDLPVLTKVVSGPVVTKFKGDNPEKLTPSETISYPKMTPSEQVSYPKTTPTETVSYPKATPTETVSYPQEETAKLTPSERISHPEKRPSQLSKVAPSAFDLHKANRQMQKDMNYLSRETKKVTPSETVSYPNMTPSEQVSYPKATPTETVSYPQEETSTETSPIMEKFESLATGDNWQEEALARFENEGGRTINTLETEGAPASTEEITSVETEQAVVAPEVAPLESKRKPRLTLEETLARIQKTDQLNMEDNRDQSLVKRATGFIRGVGETYSKFPLRYKLLLSTGMIATGLGAAAVGSAVAVGTVSAISAGARMAGASALFYTIETGLKNRAEKKGAERTNTEALRDSATAAALSIIIMGVLPSVVSNYTTEFFGTTEAAEQVAKTGVENASAAAPIVCAEIAQEGDTVWSMAERGISASLGEKFTSLSPEQQTYFIDAVKDQVVLHPDQFGLADANELQVGQGIDFGILLNNQEFMTETLGEAKGLSAEDISNISNYEGEGGTEVSVEGVVEGTPEALSTDPEVLAVADEQFHNHVNDVFGSKGFLGFGATDGLKSPNWSDPSVGFANKTVEEIMNAKPIVLPGDEIHIGIEDRASTEKMQDYFKKAFIETGIQPEQGETAEKYLKRISVLSVMHKG